MADVPTKKVGIKARGFASMSPERVREIASRGGKSVPAEKRGFSDKELAATAGRKGGKSVVPSKRTFSQDRELAKTAGSAGGKAVQAARRSNDNLKR